jgi:hypothetical protein
MGKWVGNRYDESWLVSVLDTLCEDRMYFSAMEF